MKFFLRSSGLLFKSENWNLSMKQLKLLSLTFILFSLVACGTDSDEEPAGTIVEQQDEQNTDGTDNSSGDQSSSDNGDTTDSTDGTGDSSGDSTTDSDSSTDGSNTDYNDGDTTASSDYSCDSSDHPKVGQMAVFQMYHHQVAGEALIKDNCTIEVTNFTYDGLGPDVLFYGGVDGDYRGSGPGFALSDNINGRAYDNETVTIELTSPAYLDLMNGISVWCADVDVSFGDGLFQ